jgi:hypothetical protein
MIASGELSIAVSCTFPAALSRSFGAGAGCAELAASPPCARIGELPAAGLPAQAGGSRRWRRSAMDSAGRDCQSAPSPRTTIAASCLCYPALDVHTAGGSTPRRGAFRCLPGRRSRRSVADDAGRMNSPTIAASGAPLRQGLGKSQLQRSRLLETRLHPPHATKALQSLMKF